MELGKLLLGNEDNIDKVVVFDKEESINRLRKLIIQPLIADSQLGGLIKILDNKNPYAEGMSHDEILNLLSNEFISSKVYNKLNETLFIFNLDYGFLDNSNAKSFTKLYYIFLAKPQVGFSAIGSFLHELGHVYHYNETNNLYISIPNVDEFLNSKYIKQDIFLTAYWDKVSKVYGREIRDEQFADIFMIGLTEICGLNNDSDMYNKTHPITRGHIKEFIMKLV